MNDLNLMIASSDPFQRTATFTVAEAALFADESTDEGTAHDFDVPQGYGDTYTYWHQFGECYGA